jgi:DegV family protein with EDD domain
LATQVPRIAYLDGPRLSRGLLAGIARVTADAEHLNRINVFPVPDGDTGTNLAVTLGAVRNVLIGHRDRHAGKLLERVADAALDGARGNSGAILAQFFHGLCDASLDHRLLTTSQFVAGVTRGSEYAHDALTEPRAGTILTVIQDFAAELAARLAAGGQDFATLLEDGLRRAQRSLAATTGQLEALRRAGVVDAGAQGFVDLLEGVTDFVRGGSLHIRRDARGPVADGQETGVSAPPGAFLESGHPGTGHRWCTECLVRGAALDHRRLREALAGLGSSLVIAGGKTRVRVHIHADDPQAVFEAAARFGAVEGQKADDMRSQQDAARAGARTVAVVTDSAADLPEELLTALDIHVVPARIHFGPQSYLDKVSLDTAEFYRMMAASAVHPTTSQPPPGDFRRLYQILGSHHAGIVSVHIAGWASGTLQAATSAADRAGTRVPVLAIDSRNASTGQGLIVLRAAELAAAGRSVDEIALALDGAIARTRTWALLGSLDHAVRGGRVAPSKRLLARWLRLEPILATFPDGRIATAGVLLGRHQRVRRFARWVARRAGPAATLRLAVGHANAPEAAAQLLAELQVQLPGIETAFVTEIGTALGVHGGPGTLVVSLS